MLAVWTLARREVVRFFRERSRVIGALVPPIVFWLLIGSGLAGSFRTEDSPAGMDYLQYFFPGTVLLIVLFTAIFATISVIDDRKEGFLQGVLVAPIPRSALVAGKLLGITAISFLQGLLFLALAPAVGLGLGPTELATVLAMLLLAAFALSGLGFAIAWHLDSAQGYHAVMNLFLIPMWMLSGALFPLAGSAAWLRAAAAVNPLTYAVAGMQQSFTADGVRPPVSGASPAVCLLVVASFGAVMFVLSVFLARRREASA